MKPLKYLATIYAMALSSAMAATTDPVGFVSVTVPANSDAVLAVPLNRASVFKGMIQTISGNTVTVAGTPAWTTAPQQFVQALPAQSNTYAVQLASGTKEGLIAKIVSNTVNSVTLQFDAGDDLTGVIAEDADGVAGNGDQIDIMPYWTASTLMPATTPDGTELYILKTSRAGINLGAENKFIMDGGWIDQDTSNSTADTPLSFGSAFIVRNNGAQLNLSFVGSVPMSSHRFKLKNNSGSLPQDIAFGYVSPVPEKLLEMNIPAQDGDQILIYDNSASGINKSSIGASLIMDGVWIFADSSNPVPANYTLNPGYGYIYRRGVTGSTNAVTWQDLQAYLQ